MTDILKKYLFADQSTRAQIVHLEQAWQMGLEHQHYPACIRDLLGELVAASVLLAGNLKFDGSLILQIQGDGPIALLVVECTSDMDIRATVSLRENHPVPQTGTLQTLLNPQGQGRFTVVLAPRQSTKDFRPYQGVVPLEGETVAEVLQTYMRTSEQLDTHLWLAADENRCAGLLLQRIPPQGGHSLAQNLDTWERALALGSTVQTQELLQLDSDTLIHRLFWEEDLQVFEPQSVRWHCPCSRQRVSNMLRMLGREEIEQMLAEQDTINVSCNFCGKPYQYDAIDCASLFVDKGDTQPGDDTLH